eukprot:CAMPEP_0170177612 /NCGR_PEP_ID=MMETSP0040_2-20121228/10602_1 /TAXON_ID=641309 /ORGANISM="Lotharella oceanica, Strain CCMP622" /LENGTH=234 /DNA_ID=CAMNT_0010420303 /DNA_START=29 /DNA_END=733 /DNA_ORIENTATION=+
MDVAALPLGLPRPNLRPAKRCNHGSRISALLACYSAFVVFVLAFGGENSSLSGGVPRSAIQPTHRIVVPLAPPSLLVKQREFFPVKRREFFARRSTLCRASSVDEELDESLTTEAEKKQKEIDRLRAAEKFFKKGTGDYECTECQFVYNPLQGDPEAGILKGTEFADLPEDWSCPVCGSEKEAFEEQGTLVAGFAENQGYGFGTNSMTEGQKSALIYGSLIAFFGLFLLGYKLG